MKTPFEAAAMSATTEEHVVSCVEAFLHSYGYRVIREVPNMGQSIDLVGIKGRWSLCVEVKLSDWRRGLQQCRAHTIVADHVALAIASVRVPPLLLQEAEIRGIGIIHFDRALNVCKWASKARLNTGQWRPQRRQFTSAIREIEYDG
jgi:hypothetical protein